LHPLIDVLRKALERKDHTLIKQGTWALSNLCRTKPLQPFERVADATPVLCTVVQEVTDSDIICDALWALGYLSDEEYKVTRVLEVDVVPSLIRCLEYDERDV